MNYVPSVFKSFAEANIVSLGKQKDWFKLGLPSYKDFSPGVNCFLPDAQASGRGVNSLLRDEDLTVQIVVVVDVRNKFASPEQDNVVFSSDEALYYYLNRFVEVFNHNMNLVASVEGAEDVYYTRMSRSEVGSGNLLQLNVFFNMRLRRG